MRFESYVLIHHHRRLHGRRSVMRLIGCATMRQMSPLVEAACSVMECQVAGPVGNILIPKH